MCGFESHGGHLVVIAGGVIGNMPAFEAGDFPVRGRACKAAAPCARRGFESRLRLFVCVCPGSPTGRDQRLKIADGVGSNPT